MLQPAQSTRRGGSVGQVEMGVCVGRARRLNESEPSHFHLPFTTQSPSSSSEFVNQPAQPAVSGMSSVSRSSNGHRQQKDRDGYGDGQLRSSSSSSSSRAPSSGQRAHMDWFAESQEPYQHQHHHHQRTGSAAAAPRHSQGPAFPTQSQSPGIPPSLSSPFARSASGPQMTFQAKPQYMGSRTSSSDSAKRKDFSSSQSSQSHGSKVSEMIRRFDGAGSGQQRQPSSSSQSHPHTR